MFNILARGTNTTQPVTGGFAMLAVVPRSLNVHCTGVPDGVLASKWMVIDRAAGRALGFI